MWREEGGGETERHYILIALDIRMGLVKFTLDWWLFWETFGFFPPDNGVFGKKVHKWSQNGSNSII